MTKRNQSIPEEIFNFAGHEKSIMFRWLHSTALNYTGHSVYIPAMFVCLFVLCS